MKQFETELCEAVSKSRVTIVAGDTGCGKSTQVPQYLLKHGFRKIAVTQPRRIASISLAKRVSYETLNMYGSHVAYKIRFDGTATKATRILFLTEGLLLRQMQMDTQLKEYDVIILDEVHERHLQSDLLLGLIADIILKRDDLRLVLMSATINMELFTKYFEGKRHHQSHILLHQNIQNTHKTLKNHPKTTQKSPKNHPKITLKSP